MDQSGARKVRTYDSPVSPLARWTGHVVQGILVPLPIPSRHEIILSDCSVTVAVCAPQVTSLWSGRLCDAGQLVRRAVIARPHFALRPDREIFPAQWCETALRRNGIVIGEIIVATDIGHLTLRAEGRLKAKGFKAIFADPKCGCDFAKL